ncbi:MAG: hypothetical protein RBU28_06180 [Bacteroidales bacterium]|nr:hypothetical protein [Bacteroidales bacterium]
MHITTAKVHDVNIMDLIPYERGSFYVADKAYTDFQRLHKILVHDKKYQLFECGLNYIANLLFSNDIDKFNQCCKFLSCT